jgi:hypothetical protein
MTDIAFPEAGIALPEAFEVARSTGIEGMEPIEIAAFIKDYGQDVTGDLFAWKAAGAKAMLLSAQGSQYLIEAGYDQPSLVTRVNELPEKSRKIGPYVMLPIERCEIEPDDVITLGKTFVLRGLCRVTKKLQQTRGFHTGPVATARYLA